MLCPIDGVGYECRRYAGPSAERFFGQVNVEQMSRNEATDGILALFRRHNDFGPREAGVFYHSLEANEPSEMLRFFSAGEEGYEAAESLYDELRERLGYEALLVLAIDIQPEAPPKSFGCCRCGDSAIYQVVKSSGSQTIRYFVCNEHVDQLLQELNSQSGGWKMLFVEDEFDGENEITPLPSE